MPGAQTELYKLRVCVRKDCTNSTAVLATPSRLSQSMENHRKAGTSVRWEEGGQRSGMVYQAPRHPVALQQVNL